MSDSNEVKFDRLREIAEELLRQNGNFTDTFSGEITQLLHELRVHQVELGIQNEELQRAQEQLEASKQEYTDLFDYAPLAYFVIDEKSIIKQANLTAVAKFGTTRQALHGTSFTNLIAPGERDKYYKYHRILIEKLQQRKLELWLESDTSEPFYARIEAVVVDEDDEAKTFRVAITDITERKVYEDHLEAIHQLDHMILKRSQTSEMIEVVIDQLWQATRCQHIAIILFDRHDQQTHYFVRDSKSQMTHRYGKLKKLKGDLLTADDIPVPHEARTHIVKKPDFLPQSAGRRYPAHLFAPIRNDSELQGLIDLGANWAEAFDDIPTEFVEQFAVQLGIAFQQTAFLEQIQQYTFDLETMVEQRTTQLRESQYHEREQRLFAESLLAIVKKINQSLDLEQMLEQILIALANTVEYDGAQIVIPDPDNTEIIVQSRGALQLPITASDVDDHPAFAKLRRTREPILLREDAHRFLLAEEDAASGVLAYLGVPVQSGRRLLGFINVYGTQAGAFDKEDIEHLEAFAEQVSVAVKNARFYQKGQALAALEERQRLARDLHDAVSQLIFSLSMMSESLPKIIKDQEYEKAGEISEMMRIVASSTHAEMRLLLLELRPMSFERIELDELLHQLATAFLGRHSNLTTEVDAQQTPPLSIEVKNNLYRITQEALNNIGKHAQAQNIEIKLWVEGEDVHLSVEDDGMGFDPNQQSTGYGLRIIQERAQDIGADYTITSEAGKGTRIYITYSP